MATLYRVPDGPRGQRSDDPRDITFEQIDQLFDANKLDYRGETGPEFNVEKPSDWRSQTVLQVSAEDVASTKLDKAGFYCVDIPPEDSDGYPRKT